MIAALSAALSANPGLVAALALLGSGSLVLAFMVLGMWRSGVSPRPILFVAGLYLLLTLPFLAGQLVQARAPALPPPAGAASGTPDLFDDHGKLFGPGVMARDAMGGLPGILDEAERAEAGVVMNGSTVLAARFADQAAARRAAAAYHRGFQVANTSGDETHGWSGRRMQGDFVEMLVAGRYFFVWSGLSEEDCAARRAASDLGGYLDSAELAALPPLFPALEPLAMLFKPLPVKLGGVLLLVGLYSVWFLKGASWAAAVPAVAGVTAVSADDLGARLLAINDLDVPFDVSKGEGPGVLFADWRYADAKWVDLAGASGLKRTFRIRLVLDEASHAVRATDYAASLDWSTGRGRAELRWQAVIGVVFFQRERHSVLGFQLDPSGRPQPRLHYTYRFDLNEMKSPLVNIVTRSGWSWRPTILPMPSFGRSSGPGSALPQ
jgi:hypothetical protein